MQHASPSSHIARPDMIVQLQQLLIDLLCIELNTQQINEKHNFFDLGCKSLNLRILQMHLQRRLSHPIPTEIFYSYPTIEMLARHLSTLQTTAQKG
ncbi:hypothetical protein KDH_08070 [Dictyobacter sp. S3.2.2.5]|uniref:Carrier domain-containing protein n=1 Tax=Dictyobacter halimunensis TaxID=3026934 RepID=A0ABQ6FK52_9CHLR|nr:hypothetical protein KDH_08070 [Dictyobacter sp. S3.2.2.5]